MINPKAIVQALRPKQWTKNLLLFAALIFAERYKDIEAVIAVIVGTGFFCLLSSAGYLVNDLRDVEADRVHPKKKLRPIASGRLPEGQARILAVLLIVVGIAGSFALDLHNARSAAGSPTFLQQWAFGITATSYLAVTLSYTVFFKHIVLLDVMLIAAGFLLRAVAGAAAIPVESSAWFLTCTGFGALFLGLAKRLAELRLLEHGAGAHRPILQEYSVHLLNQLIGIVTACTLMAYALYTFKGPHGSGLMITMPLVMYGMFRYLYLVDRHGEGGAPEHVLLGDRPLQICIFLFLAVAVVMLQLGG
ncbi:MAG TPA: decaprenyl-phosphate phosphoribosyltransferase [Deltaproteobacteria bacterium]|nr:decaprenyl-phosphate phosphoribosyltransferase [Deltaproteobacteria bacterium]HCP45114.1 decaprenyl-phosphate phosphoribosyltransferase [Deltaproteobacteria bacterium]|tara:strand:- start:11 stop:925 length:915 start_codon:yes stop_codon:yes gene_type:complete